MMMGISGHTRFIVLLALVFAVFLPLRVEASPDQGMVILLHGLARSSDSMDKLQSALAAENFNTCNIDYPSTDHRIATLATRFILPAILECTGADSEPLHFVTHSMGGIIVRYLAREKLLSIARVVMLSPPNRGSEVVDVLGDLWLFNRINGPAGHELGTDDGSLPLQLGPADFDTGIITGNRSINLINSMMIAGEDDGKVSVANARLEGMRDFLVLPVTHPFIMKDDAVIRQVIHFLHDGRFLPQEIRVQPGWLPTR